jgi:MCP family monocarboxylic acid transporter-like MFS transporter 10
MGSLMLFYYLGLTVPSHYFQRNRPVAMGVVASGSALGLSFSLLYFVVWPMWLFLACSTGAVIHPIMLNRLFHSHIGFHNGVRISAAFNSALLIISVSMMRTRLPPRNSGSRLPVVEFMKDTPYPFVVIACVSFFAFNVSWIKLNHSSGMLFICGYFFPPFYLQLDAIKHNVDPQFAFYCVSHSPCFWLGC